MPLARRQPGVGRSTAAPHPLMARGMGRRHHVTSAMPMQYHQLLRARQRQGSRRFIISIQVLQRVSTNLPSNGHCHGYSPHWERGGKGAAQCVVLCTSWRGSKGSQQRGRRRPLGARGTSISCTRQDAKHRGRGRSPPTRDKMVQEGNIRSTNVAQEGILAQRQSRAAATRQGPAG